MCELLFSHMSMTGWIWW